MIGRIKGWGHRVRGRGRKEEGRVLPKQKFTLYHYWYLVYFLWHNFIKNVPKDIIITDKQKLHKHHMASGTKMEHEGVATPVFELQVPK